MEGTGRVPAPEWVHVYSPPRRVWVKIGKLLPTDWDIHRQGTGVVIPSECMGLLHLRMPRADGGGDVGLVTVRLDLKCKGEWLYQRVDPIEFTIQQLVPMHAVRWWTWAEERRAERGTGPRRFG